MPEKEEEPEDAEFVHVEPEEKAEETEAAAPEEEPEEEPEKEAEVPEEEGSGPCCRERFSLQTDA